jgi:hypothetical protein
MSCLLLVYCMCAVPVELSFWKVRDTACMYSAPSIYLASKCFESTDITVLAGPAFLAEQLFLAKQRSACQALAAVLNGPRISERRSPCVFVAGLWGMREGSYLGNEHVFRHLLPGNARRLDVEFEPFIEENAISRVIWTACSLNAENKPVGNSGAWGDVGWRFLSKHAGPHMWLSAS